MSAIPTLHGENNRFSFCPDSYFAQDNSGIEPCQVRIPTSPVIVRIPTLSRTILELSRFLLCADRLKKNMVEKETNACYQHFLLFQQRMQ